MVYKPPLYNSMHDIMEIKKLLNDKRFIELLNKMDPQEFTFYDVIQMADYEIRHSNTLAWLLDTHEKHNLGSNFLLYFLIHLFKYKDNKNVLSNYYNLDNKNNIIIKKNNKCINFKDANISVKREWNYIDILVNIDTEKFIVVIENKPGIETPGQLSDYKTRIIDKYFDDAEYSRIFVFLTIDGTPPLKVEDRKYWVPLSYKEIVNIIELYVLNEKTITVINNFRIIDFIRQYTYHIKRNMINYYDWTDDSCKLYHKHKKVFQYIEELKENNSLSLINDKLSDEELNAIDYIIVNQSGIKIKFLKKIETIIKDQFNLNIFQHASEKYKWLNITIESLENIFYKNGYKHSCFINLTNNYISIETYTKSDFHNVLFPKLKTSEFFHIYNESQYSNRIYQKKILSDNDYNKYPFEELINLFIKEFTRFINKDLPLIESELNLLLK